MFALILAGGTGTRLWPRSRKALPKQLLALTRDVTMMESTVNRIRPLVSMDHVFVATNATYGPMIREKVPDIPAQNIIEEPSGKNTAPCIGLAALHMARIDPNEVMASLHSDHFIADEEGFRQALLTAAEVAREGYLVTLGVQPDKPETGYGYIKRADEIGEYNGQNVYQVDEFLEKPDLETAQKFFESKEYYWNSGIFIWQVSTLLEAFKTCMPEFHQKLGQMDQALEADEAIDPIWETIKSESIDVGIMERAEKVAVVPLDVGWNDVGSWDAIHEINEADENDNVFLTDDVISFDTTGCLVQGSNERVIATVGLENLVIIDSGDALLVCARDKAQDVKKVVNWLKENEGQDLL